MAGLQTPLTADQKNDSQDNYKAVVDQLKGISGEQLNQIQKNEVKVSKIEKPQTVFLVCFGFSFLFQILGIIIVLVNFLLQLFDYNYDSKTLGLLSAFLLFSILSVVTFIYLCSEATQWEPLNVFNSIRISFVLTLISFGIAVAIFNIFETKSWDCSIEYNEQLCKNQSNTLLSNCQQRELSNVDCYEQRMALLMKYVILIFSGIPLILMILGIYKYKSYKKQQNLENEKEKELLNVSSSQVIQNNPNFFSNTSKLIYNNDLETSKYAYSSRAMVNPQQFDMLNGNLKQKNKLEMAKQDYELNNDQL